MASTFKKRQAHEAETNKKKNLTALYELICIVMTLIDENKTDISLVFCINYGWNLFVISFFIYIPLPLEPTIMFFLLN